VIAATNRRLAAEVEAGRFREDLLYRLNVVPIRVPPLRERREDVPALIDHARKLGMPTPDVTPEALRALVAYDFPGNVRDLENTIIRAMVLAEPGDTIGLADLSGLPEAPDVGAGQGPEPSVAAGVHDRSDTAGLLDAVARYEREQIEQALAAADGNRAKAARALGISRRWLLKKLERYGMETAEAASGE
jgi:DNA-binding NtrC family response regulator